ncbi:MAG: hypothetical protein F4X20_01670 [Dehalococcoidia bacterium]|nr:hypothetical protein [Dehalococcoidia bacterium]
MRFPFPVCRDAFRRVRHFDVRRFDGLQDPFQSLLQIRELGLDSRKAFALLSRHAVHLRIQ